VGSEGVVASARVASTTTSAYCLANMKHAARSRCISPARGSEGTTSFSAWSYAAAALTG